MTDAEVICTFMEPKPDPEELRLWLPGSLTLDALWEVEERLTAEQFAAYIERLEDGWDINGLARDYGLVHARAEQKIKALAAVLRPIVEPK